MQRYDKHQFSHLEFQIAGIRGEDDKVKGSRELVKNYVTKPQSEQGFKSKVVEKFEKPEGRRCSMHAGALYQSISS